MFPRSQNRDLGHPESVQKQAVMFLVQQQPDFATGEDERGPEDAGKQHCQDNSSIGNRHAFVGVALLGERRDFGYFSIPNLNQDGPGTGYGDGARHADLLLAVAV